MSPHYLVKHRCTNFFCNGDGNGGVSKLGCTEIDFIEPGVKVNGACYCDNLLAQKLLLDMCWISQGEFFCLSTGWRPFASSTRRCLFPGARDTRLHHSSTVAAEFTRS